MNEQPGRRSPPSVRLLKSWCSDVCLTPLIPWGGTETAADPDAAVIQRPLSAQSRGSKGGAAGPGCAEADRAQRAAARPRRPKTMVRRRRGRGPAKPGRGAENAKNGRCCSTAEYRRVLESRGGRRTRKTNAPPGLGFGFKRPQVEVHRLRRGAVRSGRGARGGGGRCGRSGARGGGKRRPGCRRLRRAGRNRESWAESRCTT